MVRNAVVLAMLVALAAPVAATGDRATPNKAAGTVLAFYETRKGDYLVRRDLNSFKPMSKRLRLGGQATYAYAFSPDGRYVALGVDQAYGFRIVDLRRFKVVRSVVTWSKRVASLHWVTPRRIIGFEDAGPFVVDPITSRHLPTPRTEGTVMGSTPLGNKLVFLAGSSVEIEPARVGVIDAEARVRSVQLAGIRAGNRWDWETSRGESRVPGLALDPAGRAFVVGTADEPIAEVNLTTLDVSYHRPETGSSWLTRFRNWLEPSASAKAIVGSRRTARWLGDGKIAVSGYDYSPAADDRAQSAPAGLAIVDTRTWKRRVVDPEASHAAFVAGRLLVAHASSGVIAYSTGGERLYRLFEGEKVALWATFGSRAFVRDGETSIRIIDASNGALLGQRRALPQLVHPSFARAW